MLLVADRENRARAGPRTGAGGEFRHQPLHDLPLLGAGVLRLVDQEMIDAEIELEMDPGGIGVAQQIERLVDQVIVIDQPAALLLVAVTLQHFRSDGDEGRTAVAA